MPYRLYDIVYGLYKSTEFLENRLGRKYADGADGPIVHFYKFFWPQKCVMRS